MTKLSVNINKVATLRNARGGNNPNVAQVAVDCEAYGAEGITVHPRPDERHIRYADVYTLRPLVKTEFNIEGYPSKEFVDLVLKVKPHQVTLVPDAPDQITSNAGWDTKTNLAFLTELMDVFDEAGIRTSIFVGTDIPMIEYAAKAGADRVELYTEPYASLYPKNPEVCRSCQSGSQVGDGAERRTRLEFGEFEVFPRQYPVGRRSVNRSCTDMRRTVFRIKEND